MLAGQMRPGIKIKVIREPDDDGLYKFQISLSNGDTFASLDFWEYGDNFEEFGGQLIDFPKGLKDVVTYDVGEERKEGQPKWAYYLHVSAFCFNASGQSAVKVIVDNHADIPDHQRSEFYIKSEPANLNRLGQKLKSWTPDKEKELTWDSNGVE
jgi:hypothetical protein